jgi:hypothetical protein
MLIVGRIFVLLVLVVVFSVSLNLYMKTIPQPQSVTLLDINEATVAIVQSTKGDVDQYFQLAVLLVGAVWTVAFVQTETRLRWRDGMELFNIVCVSGTFLLFFVAYKEYREKFADIAVQLVQMKRLPNPSSGFFVDSLAQVTDLFFLCVGASAFFVFGLCMMRENRKET